MKLGWMALLLAGAGPAAARAIVVDANGYTLCAEGKLVHFATLVIGDHGRVAATYAKGQPIPAKKPGDTVVDAHGRTVLPGLIDAHGHVNELGERLLAVDLTDVTSVGAAVAKVAAHAAAEPGDGWIVGAGWNQERWTIRRFPTAADLDPAVPGRPVWLVRVDGHAGWANSAAIKAAGITAATPDPAGGRIERDAAGNPTGVFVDAAKDMMAKAVPAPTPAQSARRLETALAALAAVGVTGVGDMGVSAGDWRLYRYFADRHRLTARIAAYAGGTAAMEAIAPGGPIGWDAAGRLSLPGVKLYADGALGSRGAWLQADYAHAPGNRGLRFHDNAELRALTAHADAQGFDIAVHAIGDAANAQVLDAYAALPRSSRFRRIEHAQIVDPVDQPRFAALRVIASMQPTHATSDKGMAEDRLGAARLTGAYAWATLLKSGATEPFGSDFPVESPNPFYGLHAAVTRQDRSGQLAGGWRKAEALTFEQAFAAFTVTAARVDRIDAGALVKGRWGDFIIVDRDPFASPAGDLWRVTVDETWVGGTRVYLRPSPR